MPVHRAIPVPNPNLAVLLIPIGLHGRFCRAGVSVRRLACVPRPRLASLPPVLRPAPRAILLARPWPWWLERLALPLRSGNSGSPAVTTSRLGLSAAAREPDSAPGGAQRNQGRPRCPLATPAFPDDGRDRRKRPRDASGSKNANRPPRGRPVMRLPSVSAFASFPSEEVRQAAILRGCTRRRRALPDPLRRRSGGRPGHRRRSAGG